MKSTKKEIITKTPLTVTPDYDRVNNLNNKFNLAINSKPIEYRTLDPLFDYIIRAEQPALKDILYSMLVGYGYEDIYYEDGYVYAVGNIPVMLVSHMDTVHHDPVSVIAMSNKGTISSPEGIGGDDRCGIYSIICALNRDERPYIIFAEDEEIGCIGTQKFCADIDNCKIEKPNLNFIVEIDRKGCNDCVFYDLDNPEFEKYIESFGFTTAYGSCSDISYLAPCLDCAAVNLSSAYYNPHTLEEYIDLDELETVIERLNKIIDSVIANPETAKYEWKEKVYKYSYNSKWGRYAYDSWYDDDYYNYHNTKITSSKTTGTDTMDSVSAKTETEDDNDYKYESYESSDLCPTLCGELNNSCGIFNEVTGEYTFGNGYYVDCYGFVYCKVDEVDVEDIHDTENMFTGKTGKATIVTECDDLVAVDSNGNVIEKLSDSNIVEGSKAVRYLCY